MTKSILTVVSCVACAGLAGDIAAFFVDYEAGAPCADVDQDGGITGSDLSYFFTVYEAGGCP